MVTNQELKELPSVTKLMELADEYATRAIQVYDSQESDIDCYRTELKQEIERIVRKRMEAQVESEVLKDKLARLGLEQRKKYSSVLQQALESLNHNCGDRCNAEYNPCHSRQAADSIKKLLGKS